MRKGIVGSLDAVLAFCLVSSSTYGSKLWTDQLVVDITTTQLFLLCNRGRLSTINHQESLDIA
jgi:hypothetical protein